MIASRLERELASPAEVAAADMLASSFLLHPPVPNGGGRGEVIHPDDVDTTLGLGVHKQRSFRPARAQAHVYQPSTTTTTHHPDPDTIPTTARSESSSSPQPSPSQQWPNFQGVLPPGTSAVPSAALAEFLVEMGALGDSLKQSPITWRRVHTAFEEYVVTRGLFNPATGKTKCDAILLCLLNVVEIRPGVDVSFLLNTHHWRPKLALPKQGINGSRHGASLVPPCN